MQLANQSRVFVLNLALLATHQVDAAYWHEWQIFGLPGGLRFFLGFNLVAIATLASGLVEVASGGPWSTRWIRLCAGTGAFTVIVHAVFLHFNRDAFWTSESLLLFAAIAAVSSWQAATSGSQSQHVDEPRG